MKMLDELAKKIGRTYTAGQVIFRQGDPGDTMYLVHTGTVEVYREKGGTKSVLATLGPGEYFGEMALVDQQPRSASLGAVSDVVVVPITRDFLFKHTQKDTKFIFQILESLCRRLEATNHLIRKKYAGRPESVIALVGKQEYAEPRSASFLKSISAVSDTRNYMKVGAGEVVFKGGETGDTMYIILDGKVQIVQEEDRKRYVLVELGRGSFFGELALITGQTRTATAQASTAATLLPVGREAFIERIRTDPEVALHVVQIMIIRLRRSLRAVG